MTVVQVKLKHENSEMITWIPHSSKIQKGIRLTLRHDEDTLYEVVEVFSTMDSEQLKRGWDNNI